MGCAGLVWVAIAGMAQAAEPEVVTLVAPGTGERVVRTVLPPVGTHQEVSLAREMSLHVVAMGQVQEAREPRVEADVDLDVKSATPEKADVTWAYITTRGGGPTVSQTYQDLRGLHGAFSVTTDGDLDALGARKGFDLDLWTVRLPTEAVGVGATWTVVSQDKNEMGVVVGEKQTITLVGIEAGRLHVKVVLEQDGEPADTVLQGMPARIVRHRTVGIGDLVIDPARPLAVSGTWSIDLDVGLHLAGGQVKSNQKTHLDLSIGTRG